MHRNVLEHQEQLFLDYTHTQFVDFRGMLKCIAVVVKYCTTAIIIISQWRCRFWYNLNPADFNETPLLRCCCENVKDAIKIAAASIVYRVLLDVVHTETTYLTDLSHNPVVRSFLSALYTCKIKTNTISAVSIPFSLPLAPRLRRTARRSGKFSFGWWGDLTRLCVLLCTQNDRAKRETVKSWKSKF